MVLMISKLSPKNIMMSDFWIKNYQIVEWGVSTVSKFDGKKLFHVGLNDLSAVGRLSFRVYQLI